MTRAIGESGEPTAWGELRSAIFGLGRYGDAADWFRLNLLAYAQRERANPGAEGNKSILQDFSVGSLIHRTMGTFTEGQAEDQPLRSVLDNIKKMKFLLSQNTKNREIFIRSYINDSGSETIDGEEVKVPPMNHALRDLINDNFALFKGFTFDTSGDLEPDSEKTITTKIDRTE